MQIKTLFENKLYRFLLTATIIYFLWTILYSFWILPDHRLDHFLSSFQSKSASIGLNMLGENASLKIVNKKVFVILDEVKRLRVSDSCNGLVLFIVYCGFILAMPSSLKLKLIFVPLGIGVILLCNIIRIMLLLLIFKYSPQYLNFNHHYTFTIIIYSIIFLMWYKFMELNKSTYKINIEAA